MTTVQLLEQWLREYRRLHPNAFSAMVFSPEVVAAAKAEAATIAAAAAVAKTGAVVVGLKLGGAAVVGAGIGMVAPVWTSNNERYHGWFGVGRWWRDAIFGSPNAVQP